MTPQQIAGIGQILIQVEQLGLEVAGGIKALVALFRAAPTDAELDATVDAVMADAQRRRDELAAGLPAKS